MGGSLGPVSVRPRLEVRLEDRLQDELERSLDHAVPDRGDAEHADLAPALRYLLSPVPQWAIRTSEQFVPYLPEEAIDALALDGGEGHPV